jgi:hypothetical protein
MSSISLLHGAAPPRRHRSIWLVGSLGVNLILIGLVLAWIVGVDHPPHPLTDWQTSLLPSLSPQDAVVAQAALQRLNQIQSVSDAKLQAAFAQVHAAATATPFDIHGLEKSLDGVDDIRTERHIAMKRNLLDELSQLSADGRTRVLAAFDRAAEHWSHRQVDPRGSGGQ